MGGMYTNTVLTPEDMSKSYSIKSKHVEGKYKVGLIAD